MSEFHALECDVLLEAADNFNDFDVLTPLRFLAMKQKNAAKYQELQTLVGHLDMKKTGPDWSRISSLVDKIMNKYSLPDVSQLEVESAICHLESNSYQVISSQDSLNGIYVQASMLNHTCFKANSRPTFASEFLMKVVATDEIAMGLFHL